MQAGGCFRPLSYSQLATETIILMCQLMENMHLYCFSLQNQLAFVLSFLIQHYSYTERKMMATAVAKIETLPMANIYQFFVSHPLNTLEGQWVGSYYYYLLKVIICYVHIVTQLLCYKHNPCMAITAVSLQAIHGLLPTVSQPASYFVHDSSNPSYS